MSVLNFEISEAAYGGVSWKTVFIKILHNSLEETCAAVSLLLKLQSSGNAGVFFWI